MEWTATTRQQAFIEADTDEALYGGAAGGGKSDAVIIFNILRRQAIPGSKGLILRRTYPELERSLILRSQELLTGRAAYQGQQHRWRFPNGSILEFGYCEQDSDVYKYQSAEYEDICFDELTQFTEFQFTYMMSRCRTTKPGVKTLVRGATNPGGIGHGWVKKRFIDICPHGQVWTDPVTGRTRLFVQAKLVDNPHIQPGYEASLNELPEDQRRALKDGDWDVFAGQYFPEFRRDIHVIKPQELPSWWKRFRSLDYGLDCCACYWWAVAGDGRCRIYRELYQPNLTLSQAAERILAMSPAGEKISYTVASPDLWNRRQDTGFSGSEVMYMAGLKDLQKADHDRIPGWRVLREYLTPFKDDQGQTAAQLQIFDTCPNIIRTLPTLIHDDHNPEDVSDKCEDHGPESVRYGCMSRPGQSVLEVMPRLDKLPQDLQDDYWNAPAEVRPRLLKKWGLIK